MSRGLSERWGTDPRAVDLIIGTLSKAFVSCGGFIAAEARVLEWLHFTLPGFVFSVGLAPPIAAAAGAALRILREEPWRIARLHAISQHFVAEADRLGLDELRPANAAEPYGHLLALAQVTTEPSNVAS